MAIYDLRILLETVEGRKTSYYTSGSSYGSFVDTDTELILSASTAYHRITASISCSYQNTLEFTGDIDTSKQFKDNLILSSSLTGSENTGSIDFKATDKEYDRLLRYKFIGDKVCTVLGLPSNQWIYVDQVRFPTDDEANFFQGNLNIGNAFVSDTLTFANNANVNSDIPFYIDTGSDRYIKFIDTREQGKVSLLFGYDKDTDTYEINASSESIFNIRNLNNLTVDTINAAVINQITSSTLDTLVTSLTGETLITGSLVVSGSDSDEPIVKVLGDISQSHGGIITSSGIFIDGTSTFKDDIFVQGNVTATTFTTNQINTADGSNTFGNSLDDKQSLTGSVNITGSLNLTDNTKAIFGTGNDLQIYHSGNNSFIHDAGTGDLKILGTNLKLQDKDGGNYLTATDNAGVKIFFNESEKLETTDSGINVTGAITMSGELRMNDADIRTDSGRGFDFLTLGGSAQQINIGQLAMSSSYARGNEAVEAMNTSQAAMFGGDVSIGPHENGKLGVGMLLPISSVDVTGDLRVSTNITASGFISASGDGNHFIGGKINLNSATPANQEIKFGGAARIQGNDTFIILDSDNQFVARADDKMNFNTPLFGLGGFDTGDTPSATLHVSGAGNTTLFVEGDITSSGTGKFEKVGIGAPTPSLGLLHISGSGTNINYSALFQTTGSVTLQKFANSSTKATATDGFDIGVNASDARLIQRENADMIFSTNNAERMRLKNDGTLLMSVNKTISSSIIEATHITASSYTGSFVGDGTGLTGVTAEWDGSINGDGEITGSLVLSGTGHITASGNISASGTITAEQLTSTDDLSVGGTGNGRINVGSIGVLNGESTSQFGIASPGIINIQADNDDNSAGSADRIDFEVGTTEIMRISGSGNVGIGTSSPLSQLHIQESTVSNFDPDNFANFIIEDNDARMQIVSNDGGNNGSALILTNVSASTHNNWAIGTATSAQNSILHIGYNTSTSDVSTHTAADVVIDKTGNIGVGTATPQKKLHINNSGILIDGGTGVESDAHAGTARFIIDSGGSTAHDLMDLRTDHGTLFRVNGNNDTDDFARVGIGTDSPQELLHIAGTSDPTLVLQNTNANDASSGKISFREANGTTERVNLRYDGDANKFIIDTEGKSNAFVVDRGTGNIGIGTTAPTKPLQVTGEISSSGDLTISDGTRQLQYDVSAGELNHSGATLKINNTNGVDTSFDNGTLYVDASANRVGIGVTNPTGSLTVAKQMTPSASFFDSPHLKLEALSTDDLDGKVGIVFESSTNRGGFGASIAALRSGTNGHPDIVFNIHKGDKEGNEVLRINEDGKVGIGTTDPENLVSIQGGMLSITSSEGSHIANGDSSGQAPSGNWQQTLRLGDNDGNNGFTTLIDDGGTSQYSLFTNRFGVKYHWFRGSPNDGIQKVALLRGHDTDQFFDLFDGTTSTAAVRLVATGSKETYFNYGNVAIGTTSPQSKLHVDEGDIRIDSAVDGTQTLRWSEANNTRAEIQYSGVNNRLNINTDDGSDNPINRITIKGEQDLTEVEVTGNLSSSIMIADTHITSQDFVSGFAGSGYRLEQGDKSLLTVDDLTVRGTMSVFELLIHQVRATNGSLFVSNTGKITSASLSSVDNHYSMSFDTGSGYGHSFQVGDLIRAQRFVPSTNGSGSQVFKSDLHIVSVNGTGSAIGVLTASADEQHPLSQSAPQPGYEYVRIGSTTTTDRQGSIYLTADDDHAPFIDVVDELTEHSQFNTAGKTKVRLGKLSGVGTTAFGSLTGYGLYASGSAFLEGSINADGGTIGGWNISKTGFGKNNVNISSSGIITLGVATELNTGTGIFMSGSNNSAFRVGNPEGDNFKFDGTNVTITSSKFQLLTGDTSIATDNFELDAVGLEISSTHASMSLGEGKIILSGSTVPVIKIDGGEISASKFFVDSQGQMTASAGQIGGFIIDDHSLTTDGVEINKTGQALFISSSNFKVNHTGDITASNVDLTGKITATSGQFSGDVIATHINTTSGSIGGFTIGTNKISSDNLVLSSSTTATDFIVSASNFNVKAGGQVTASNIRADGGTIGGFEIDADEIKAGSTLVLDSDTNSGEIKLGGATGITSGDGIYMAGDKKFRVGQASNNFIRFNNTANILEIKTPALDLDSSGNLTISGTLSSSVGNIGGFTIGQNTLSTVGLKLGDSTQVFAISSSNFQINQSGDVTASNVDLTGKITAQTGTIGGFNIGTDLDASSGTLKLKGADGQITGSNVLFNGGEIGGFEINNTEIKKTNITMSNANGGKITLNQGTIFLSGSGEGQFANGGITFDKDGNTNITGSVTIGADVEIQGDNGFNTIFFDDFSQYPSITDLTSSGDSPRTNGSGQGYVEVAQGGAGEKSFVTNGDEIFGNRALRLGDDSGNDEVWLSSNRLIPFNSHSLYEVEIRIKKSEDDDDGSEFVGITGYAADGTTKVNTHGADSFGSQHYFALSGTSVPNDNEYRIFKGYFKGHQGRIEGSPGGRHQNITDPGVVSSGSGDTGNKVMYFAPLILVNYNNVDGVATIDYIRISEFNDGNGTKISGDNIQTGKITSNNLSTVAGSEFNLQDGTFKLGGTANPDLEFNGSSLIVSGSITASSGLIGGFKTDATEISASDLVLKSGGQITASRALIDGNSVIGGFNITDSRISSQAGTLILSSSGKITGSNVLFSGGEIGGFEISSTQINSSNDKLILKDSGQITGSEVLFNGGTITGDVSIQGGLEIGALPEFPSNENLIAHWDFNGFTSGSSVDSNDFILDNSGNNLSGSVLNTFQIAGGIAGNAVLIQSESNGAIVWDYDELDSLNHESNFTMAVWAKRFHPTTGSADPSNKLPDHPTANTDGQPIFLKGSTSDSFGIDYRFGSNQVRCGMRSGSLTRQVNFTMDDDLLNFHHLAFTFESGSDTGIKLYVDGVERGSTTSKGLDGLVFPSADHIKVGGSGVIGGNGGPFNGFLDEPRVYSKTLSSNEVRALYLSPEGIGGTLISGDQITTGRIKSNNLSTTDGSEFNLNDGTFKLGGTSNPALSFDGSTLQVSGTLSSSVGNIGGFTIGASTLVAGNLTLDSTNEQIKLGGSAGATSTTGIFLDSDGTFNFATDANNFIRKNGTDLQIKSTNVDISGSDVSIQTPKIFLGAGDSNFISASDGNIEISSSNFHLQQNGDLTGSSVLFDGGTIGGFTINETNLSNIDSNGGISIDAGNKIITARTGSASDTVRVRFGKISSSPDKFGIQGEDVSGNTIFNIGEQGNNIAGFEFDEQKIITSGSDGNTSGVEVNSQLGIIGHGDETNREFETHTGMFRFSEDTVSTGTGGQPITIQENAPLTQEGGQYSDVAGEDGGDSPS